MQRNRRLGTPYPATGHYRGSDGVEDQFVYVAQHEDGRQQIYTPAEFAEKFGWKNDPEKATLLRLEESSSGE